jgi:hypothetical protein
MSSSATAGTSPALSPRPEGTTAYWSLEAGVERVLAAVGVAEVPAGLEVIETGPVDVDELVAKLRAGGAVIIDRLSMVRAAAAGTRAQEETAVLTELQAAARATGDPDHGAGDRRAVAGRSGLGTTVVALEPGGTGRRADVSGSS